MITNESITKSDGLLNFLESKSVPGGFQQEIVAGFSLSSMPLKITNHVLNLIDWNDIINDPIRKQFLIFKSEYKKDHPMLKFDSLGEKHIEVSEGILHRYPKSVLFFINRVCPTYCGFCTRSYTVGTDTDILEKHKLSNSFSNRLNSLIKYLKNNKTVMDLIISGGDVSSANIGVLKSVLERILTVDSISSVRLATRGLTFSPEKFNIGSDLYNLLAESVLSFKRERKELSLQCHFNHRNEINETTEKAISNLIDMGLIMRNQSVLLKNINSDTKTVIELIEKLITLKIQPYYVYQMDMVKNAEHFRTTIEEGISIYNDITGLFPGYLTPKFVVDLPNGGGKKNICAYEWADKEKGIFAYKSAISQKAPLFYYYNPQP